MCVPLSLVLFHNAAITRQYSLPQLPSTVTTCTIFVMKILIKTGAPFWRSPVDMLTIPGSNLLSLLAHLHVLRCEDHTFGPGGTLRCLHMQNTPPSMFLCCN